MKNQSGKTGSTSNGTRWGQVFLIVGAGIVVCFQVGKAPPVLPVIMEDLKMSLFSAGWILSTFNIIGLILGSIIGALSDTFGHRRMLLWGLVCQTVGSFLGALSPNASVLLGTRVMEGLGFFMMAVSGPSLILQVTRTEDLRLALSIWSCWLPTGTAIIMFLMPIITAHFGWRGLWLVNAGILAGYALWIGTSSKGLRSGPRERKTSMRRLWRDIGITSTSKGPVLLAITFSTFTLQWLAVVGFLPTLLIESYGTTPEKASILTGLIVVINAPGNLAGGWLLKRGFQRWLLIAIASLVMGLCSLGIYSDSLPFVMRYVACLIFSSVGGFVPASIFGGVPHHAPRQELVATTNGIVMQGSQLGNVLGPPALAMVVSRFGGWQAAPLLLVLIAALGIAFSLRLAALERSTSY